MKQLIVNADDFGITRGITDGVLEGHRRGMITSATIMANMPAFAYAADMARSYPSLGIGLHLNLIDGPPVSSQPLPGLLNARGSFWGSVGALVKQLCLGRVRVTTLEAEMRAQIEKALQHVPELTHLDGHKHVHILPGILPSVLRLAREYGIPCVRFPSETPQRPPRGPGILRGALSSEYLNSRIISWLCLFARRQFHYNTVVTADHFFGVTHTGLLNRNILESLLRSLPDGVSELMCHPGYTDADLAGVRTRLRMQRERELEALTDPRVMALVRECNVRLINFRDLARTKGMRMKDEG